jgi:antitoxin VapB
MPIHLRNPRAERLARELSAMTGETITDAILRSLEDRIAKEQRRARPSRRPLTEELLAIGRRCAALPLQDERSADEILGYDERGLPV